MAQLLVLYQNDARVAATSVTSMSQPATWPLRISVEVVL
jgi:hypothetical protein